MNLRVTGLVLISLTATACGQGTDPMTVLGDPSRPVVGTMSLPLSSSTAGVTLSNGFNSSTNAFILTGWNNGISVPAIIAPVSGVISQVDVGSQTVTIMANSRVSVQLTYVTPIYQVGAYVTQGAQIGTAVMTQSQVKFAVLADGVPVCPLSYLSTSARSQLYTYYTTNPCQ